MFGAVMRKNFHFDIFAEHVALGGEKLEISLILSPEVPKN